MTFLLFALPLLSAAAEDASLLQSRPTSALIYETIELKPAAGHHFNVEAPQKCGKDRAEEVLPNRFRCQLKSAGKVPVLLSLCDDAKTFCRQESFDVEVRGVSRTTAKTSPVKASPKNGRHAPEGFLDAPAKARALARREGRLLFIDFYAIWCPPCNELEEYAFPDPAFRAASEDFVKVALDADAESSFDWKSHFKVGGYPTLIVADSDLRELGRIVDFRSGPALAKFLEQAKAFKDEPIETAAKLLAKGGPEATELRRLRVAHWRAERGEFSEIENLLSGLTSPAARRELLLARREKARREEDAAARLGATKDLAAAFPNDPAFVEWAEAIAEEDKASGEILRPALIRSVETWSVSPLLGETGNSAADFLSNQASFYEALGSTAEAKAVYSKAADAYAAQASASPLKVPRAANLARIFNLKGAGRKEEALTLTKSLVEAYPGEFTFNYEYASSLSDDGRASDAYPYAVKAVESGYGDNWLRAVRLKAELELKLGRTEEAGKTVDEALAQTVMPQSTAVRTGRYLIALRRLRAKIGQQLAPARVLDDPARRRD